MFRPDTAPTLPKPPAPLPVTAPPPATAAAPAVPTTPATTSVPTTGWRAAFLFEPRWPVWLLGAVVVIGLFARVRPVWGFFVVAAVAVPLERLFTRHPDQPTLRHGLRTDIFHFLFTNLLSTAAIAVSAVICVVVLRPLTIPVTSAWLAAQPPLVTYPLGFVAFTFLLYWQHRLSHTVPFLWRFHAVHHSSANLDWVAAARLHPMEFFFGGFLLVPPLIIFGFQPVQVTAFSAITTAWAVLEHANVRWRLRWMDRLYPNPEYHHWHHSLHAEAIDTNFGLPLWDTLFGTYHMPADARPDTYGINEPMPSSYWGQMAQPFRSRRPAASAPPRRG